MKINKKSMYFVWSAGIILCLVLSLFALLFSSCASPKSEGETGSSASGGFAISGEGGSASGSGDPAAPVETVPQQPQETPEAQTPQPVSTRLGVTEDAGRDYLDSIVFLGDSTTYGIAYYYDRGYSDLAPSKNVWTPASGTLTLSNYAIATIVYPETGEELTIVDAVTRAKPEYMVITLGVNGVSFMDEEWFITDYTALVQSIQAASPDTKIILNSIYPVAASYKYQSDINNDKINAANGWIERVAESTGVRFLYSFEAVVGGDGYLPESSQNGDGLHLTGEAFTTVMDYIRTHAYQ